MKTRNLAIIPARGGSKRIPGKNIKPFLGKPIIGYSIKTAIDSKCFNEIMVSTRSRRIIKIAKKFGATVPFLRSTKNSSDQAGVAEVIAEVLEEYEKRGKSFDFCCCLYPTAPFVTPQLLKLGFKRLKKSNADSLVPVVRFSYPIQRSLKIVKGQLKMVWSNNYSKRSQDCQPRYHDAGQFYWLQVKNFLKQKEIFCNFTIPLHTSELESQDIDNLTDWQIAEIKYKILRF